LYQYNCCIYFLGAAAFFGAAFLAGAAFLGFGAFGLAAAAFGFVDFCFGAFAALTELAFFAALAGAAAFFFSPDFGATFFLAGEAAFFAFGFFTPEAAFAFLGEADFFGADSDFPLAEAGNLNDPDAPLPLV